jgi:cyclase
LVIEIDGSVHDSEEAKLNDEKRQNDLENMNLTVIRFTNNQVKNEIELVIEKIFSTIEKITANKELST